jgi:hypothetical protein
MASTAVSRPPAFSLPNAGWSNSACRQEQKGLGTKLTTIISVGMGEPDLRSLERICRAQAALTTHEPTKHALEKMAEEYRRQADFQDSQQDKEQ